MANTNLENRAQAVFQGLLDLGPDRRPTALDLLCDGDPALRAQVLILLDAQRDAGGILDTPILLGQVDSPIDASPERRGPPSGDADAPPRGPDPLVGCRIGRYEILRPLGAGAMGAVYEARQEQPQRCVAIKLIRPDADSHAVQRRFAREAHVLGQLRHSGIAQIYEAGVAPILPANGGPDDSFVHEIPGLPVPFLAMELIHGRPIDRYVREQGLDLRERLRLIAVLCDAVGWAHARGIIHRDLKPANILVDEHGQPKVLDFGVARLTGGDAPATLQTEAGQIVGTLAYMSPEQVDARPGVVDARSDVYSLGVLLYELVGGSPPYRLAEQSLPEAARIIRDEEPTRLGSLDSRFRGDIEIIVGRALEKDRDRRYSSASELGADLRRYLADEPIVARPASVLYQIRKFARRNRALAAGTVGTIAALLAGVVAATHFAIGEMDQRRVAEARSAEAERIAYNASIAAAIAAYSDGDLTLAQRNVHAAPAALRGWEWEHLNWASRPVVSRLENPEPVAFLTLSRDGSLLAATGIDNTVTIWEVALPASRAAVPPEAALGRIRSQLRVSGSIAPLKSRISPDNRRMLMIEAGFGVSLWDLETGTRLWSEHASSGDFSADGTLVVVPAGRDGVARLHDAATGEFRRELVGRRTGAADLSAAFHSDGKRLRIDSIIYDIESGNQIADIGQPYSIALDPDWSRLVRTFPDFKIEALPERSVLVNASWTEPWRPEWQFWAPDGKAIFLVGPTGLTRVVDTTLSLAGVLRLPPHRGPALKMSWLFSWNSEWIELRELFGSGVYHLPHPPRFVTVSAALSRDCRRIAVGDWGHIRMHDAETGEVLWCTTSDRSMHSAIAFSPDGRRLAVGNTARTFILADAETGFEIGRAPIEFTPRAIAWLPAGSSGEADSRVVIAGSGGAIQLYDADRLADPPRTIGRHLGPVNALAVSPGGRLLASGSGNGVALPEVGPNSSPVIDDTVRIWDRRSWNCMHVVECTGAVSALAFSPDGATLAVATTGGGVAFLDATTGAETATWKGIGGVRGLAYNPGGDRVAAFAGSNARVWDVDDRSEVAAIPIPKGGMISAAFTPDGASLIGTGRSTLVVRLDTRPGKTDPRAWFYLNWAQERVARHQRALNAEIERSLQDDSALPDPVREAALRTIHATGNHLGYLVSDGILNIRGRHQNGPAAIARALRRFECARTLTPEDAGVAFLHGVALYYAGEFAAARQAAHESIELAQRAARAPNAGPVALISLCEARLNNLEQSRAAQMELCEITPDPDLSLEARELIELALNAD